MFTKIIGKNAVPVGIAPAIMLVEPRFPHNVGMVVRLASCYGFSQVWFTGDRVRLEMDRMGRLPREERMKGYKDVKMIQFDRPLEQFPKDTVPVAVELRPNSERLHEFDHPEKAVYVFGPEDGSIPLSVLKCCHRFVVIPTRHCLNLATACSTVLWDRIIKKHIKGDNVDFTMTSDIVSSQTNPADLGLYGENDWPKSGGLGY